MATLQTKWPTLLDFAKASDPDGKISQVAEILTETNEILEDMVYSTIHPTDETDIQKLEEMMITKREKEILTLLLSGKGNKEIAEALGISITTVSKALKNYSDVSAKTKKAFDILVAYTDQEFQDYLFNIFL